MKSLDWLFVPTLAGYLFLSICIVTRYSITRQSGYHLFFRSAFIGVFLYVAAVGVNLYLGVSAPGPNDINLMVFMLAVIPPFLFNCVYTPRRAARRVAKKANNLIELLLDEAIRNDLFVEVSLRNGKAYIGSVLSPGLGSDDSDIALIPVLSGYRDKDTQELKITTRYSGMISRAISDYDLGLSYFRVVVPMSEVVSARIFDFDVASLSRSLQTPPPTLSSLP